MSNENFNDAAVEAAAEEAVAAEAVAEQVEEIAEEAAEVVAEGIEALDAESYRTETGEDTDAVIERAPLVFDRPVQTVGRRKEAIARARLVAGTGQFIINGKRSLEEYFPNKLHQQLIKSPLVAVERTESFDIHVKVAGGGPSGQAGALRLAIARGLIEVSPEDRSTLKKAGFLTRDARAVERKKYGLKKARKASQYSKR